VYLYLVELNTRQISSIKHDDHKRF